MTNIHLTFDLDWAPDHVLQDFAALLSGVKFPVTVFATHRTAMVDQVLEMKQVETAIHPNFIQQPSEDAVLDQIFKLFPNSRGVRNHRLYYHSGLLSLYQKRGIEYLSNDLMFLQDDLKAFYDWSGMVRLPIYWEDDVHSVYFDREFSLEKLNIRDQGLKIFNFHPIHLYLNTQALGEYMTAKADIGDQKRIQKHQKKGKGTRTFFEEVVKSISKTENLLNLARRFKETNPWKSSSHLEKAR